MTETLIKFKIPEELEKKLRSSHVDITILLKRLIKHLEEEREMINWSVKLQRASRKGRYDELKRREVV